VRGLFEGVYYNTQMGEVRAVYSRARSIQGRGLIDCEKQFVIKHNIVSACFYVIFNKDVKFNTS